MTQVTAPAYQTQCYNITSYPLRPLDPKLPHLSICMTCRDGREDAFDGIRGGARLATAVLARLAAERPADVGVRGVTCMSQCKRPCAIALSGPDRFTYLFGDLDPARHAGDVVSITAAYAASAEGFLPRHDRPEVLRAGILGRIPPLSVSCDLVVPLFPMPNASNPKAETG